MRKLAQKQNQKPVSSSLARPHLKTSERTHHENILLHLQRTIGNQAVLGILQSDAKIESAGRVSPHLETPKHAAAQEGRSWESISRGTSMSRRRTASLIK